MYYCIFLFIDGRCFDHRQLWFQQNQVSISQSVAILSDVLGEKLPLADVEAAYLMFECLTEHDYGYYCILCGHHPAILLMEPVRETRFRHAGLCYPLLSIYSIVYLVYLSLA